MYSSSHHGTFNPAVVTNEEELDMQISKGVIRLKPSALARNTLLDLHNSSNYKYSNFLRDWFDVLVIGLKNCNVYD